MIHIHEEHAEQITFENTRSGFRFVGWLREGTQRWLVTREGERDRAAGDWAAHQWGAIEEVDDGWVGYAGTLPDTQGVPFETREKALEWVTNDRAPGDDPDHNQ